MVPYFTNLEKAYVDKKKNKTNIYTNCAQYLRKLEKETDDDKTYSDRRYKTTH